MSGGVQFDLGKKSSSSSDNNGARASEDMFEVIWHGNQPIILHTQSRNSKNTPPPPQPPPSLTEDEMAVWLQYPFMNLYSDLVYPDPNNPNSSTQPPLPPPLPSPTDQGTKRARSCDLFSKAKPQPPVETPGIQPEITVVESNGSPITMEGGYSVDSDSMTYASSLVGTESEMDNTNTDATSETISDYEITNEATSEDSELEYVAAKKSKHANGATDSMASCAAEVNNPPRRRRREMVKRSLKALRDLNHIPNLDSSDDVSMLEDTVDYMKKLKMQVKMLSMQCPFVYPGCQPPGMGTMSVGMGMRMGMGVARPVMNFRPPAAGLPNQARPYVLRPPIRMHPLTASMHPNTQPNTNNRSLPPQTPGMQQYPIQYMVLRQMQMSMPQVEMQTQSVQNDPSPPQPASSSETSTSVTEKEHTDEKDG